MRLFPPDSRSRGLIPLVAIILMALLPGASAVPVPEGPSRAPQQSWTRAWSRPLSGAINLAAGDWDGDGRPEVLAAVGGGFFSPIRPQIRVFSLADGDLITTFAVPSLNPRRPGRLRVGSLGATTPVLALTKEPWAQQVTVLTTGGQELWRYPEEASTGVDDIDWVDVDGDGKTELLVGFNGFRGLDLVSTTGTGIWINRQSGNFWNVAGVAPTPYVPAAVFASWKGERIMLLDAEGEGLVPLTPAGRKCTVFSAATIDSSGLREVVAFAEPDTSSGKTEALAVDLERNVLWSRKVDWTPEWSGPRGAMAVDVAGKGSRQWLLQTARGRVELLDRSGGTVAVFQSEAGRILWTATESANGAVLVVFDGKTLCAYRLPQPE